MDILPACMTVYHSMSGARGWKRVLGSPEIAVVGIGRCVSGGKGGQCSTADPFL